MSTDPIIGRRSFTVCVERDVYLDGEGQYVLDSEVKVYGVWLADDAHVDEPVIVSASANGDGSSTMRIPPRRLLSRRRVVGSSLSPARSSAVTRDPLFIYLQPSNIGGTGSFGPEGTVSAARPLNRR